MGMSPVNWHRPVPSRGSTRRSSTRTSRPSRSSRRGWGLPEAFAQAAASKPDAREVRPLLEPALPIEWEPCAALAPPSKGPSFLF